MNVRPFTSALLSVTLALSLPLQAQSPVLWSGGIGEEERATAPAEGTKLVFFAEGGRFVANVKVQVSDAGGKLLVDTVVDGPWLILRLPAGRYRVQAETGGSRQGGIIEVGEGSREFAFKFSLDP